MTLYVTDLTVRFGDRTILDQISFAIPDGEIVGLVAPNGTGKTTLFNAIMRYIPIQAGEIKIFDTVYGNSRKDILRLHEQVTFFPDQADLFETFSGREHIQLYAETWHKDASRAEEIIRLLHMEHYADTKVQTYSLGMRQRLCFAMMCAADTKVMLMDEVMNGLDPENVNLVSGVLQQLRTAGKIIIVSSHLLANLDEYADRIFFLEAGKITFIHDHHKQQPFYVKAKLHTRQFRTLQAQQTLPAGTLYLDNGLCCIPITSRNDPDGFAYMKTLEEYAPKEIAIGQLGTAEHYIRIYDFTTENKE